jgi:ubiquitin carboxyl-terminal hydrolase 4/11/15
VSKEPIADDNTPYELDRATLGIEILDESRLQKDRIKSYDIDESAPSKKLVGGGSAKVRESIDLTACINAYTLEETLNEQNAWFCPKCKDFKCATKKFDIWSVPKVLIVHLKRFQYSRMYRDKIDTFVDFPVENFDLSKWVIGSQSEGSLIYDLYGVSNHMGGLGGGHYTAYIKSAEDGKWYDMNDSSTSSVGASEIKSSSAYVLFYQRRD